MTQTQQKPASVRDHARARFSPQLVHEARMSKPTVVEVDGIHKSYGDQVAVSDVSFTIEAGDVLGMVGPNGAGKTTTIRSVLDIIQPDSGSIRLFGEPFSDDHLNRLGYLPEERGLYRDLKVQETLRYLGRLKGLSKADAKTRADEALERLGMAEHRDKKVSQLSRGMTQLIQMAATIAHRPELLILDEPFSGLDPLNVRLLKDVLGELRGEGVAIVLSTHQMNQVEELCDRVLMINRGQVVLYGTLGEVRRSGRRETVLLEADEEPGDLPGVESVTDQGSYYELVLADGTEGQAVLQLLVERGVRLRRFEIAAPPLEQIFIEKVGERNG